MESNLDPEKFYIEFRRKISDSSGRSYRFFISKILHQKITQTSTPELSFELVIDRDILYFELQYAELILYPSAQDRYVGVQLSCLGPSGENQLPGPIGKGQILYVATVKT